MSKFTHEEYVKRMIKVMKEKLQKDYPDGKMKRDAHPKSLGLLKAVFTISSDLPEALKVGLFKEARSYPALIRLSNSSNKAQPDSKKDVRGFAIKLLGVEEDKFIDGDCLSQDFLLVSTETMPLGTVELFHDAIYYNLKVNPVVYLGRMVLQGNGKKLIQLVTARQNHTSPLDINYYSTTPYQFGNQVVKYKIAPTSPYKSEMPTKLTGTYLSDNMQKHLNQSEATFDFMIQFQKTGMPIDDAAVKWDETKSPFIKVGEITIPIQQFQTEKREEMSELLSFTPGHALMAHQPVGGLNRARMKIYQEMSAFRHYHNGRPLYEPTLSDYENL
ncbi:MAG: hypothetical protein ACRCST_06320 [Turicibacter sp.]